MVGKEGCHIRQAVKAAFSGFSQESLMIYSDKTNSTIGLNIVSYIKSLHDIISIDTYVRVAIVRTYAVALPIVNGVLDGA
ncbi:MAG TPA: hypothetical protein DEG17_17650 [Cyanobacteria bacterium UBA11149]|nr:hypothetical protein [Cyanobacteria bacterium UBA11367]HBE58580.1 hypothetical protein [Cyanobacteria bacterium UBA11366]HBK65779.1 hypothetical protein [Cyanobacteria bacterium UBA11166]HBR74031.1 hypothetical protein [Cyanobacteria bacterium UBA11159]HBS67855.1 hypothetical protein [Cyanobacteria bacterium UBA11153]HBW90647.1 hypothetical protein [Cyanobacteria bacterium UBA11149]HCA93706.1 hypothetical protein [Cyanobacteria bacterium UBA9226]